MKQENPVFNEQRIDAHTSIFDLLHSYKVLPASQATLWKGCYTLLVGPISLRPHIVPALAQSCHLQTRGAIYQSKLSAKVTQVYESMEMAMYEKRLCYSSCFKASTYLDGS